MTRYFFTILGILLFITLNGKNHKAHDLKLYEGEWLGVRNQTDTFKLVFKLEENWSLPQPKGSKAKPICKDILFGKYIYSCSGIIESTNISLRDTSNLTFHNMIDSLQKTDRKQLSSQGFAIYITSDNNGKRYGWIDDNGRPQGKAYISFTLNPNNPNEAVWKIVRIATEASEVSHVFIGEHGQRELDSLNAVPPMPPSELTQIPEWHMVRVKKQ